jgi:hypothetical protein
VKDDAFAELVTSIRQAGRIRRGAAKASRVTTFRPADVRAVRAKLKATQAEFALLIGVRVGGSKVGAFSLSLVEAGERIAVAAHGRVVAAVIPPETTCGSGRLPGAT